jgi:hypothetical protein
VAAGVLAARFGAQALEARPAECQGDGVSEPDPEEHGDSADEARTEPGFFPPVVTGTILLMIGIALTRVAVG